VQAAIHVQAACSAKLLGNLAEMSLDRLGQANQEIRILTR
jgi:hypothetical protein